MANTGSIKQNSPPKTAGSTQQQAVNTDLPLQEGSVHGTYTWGVLDRLPEQSWLSIEDISGIFARTMDAAALVSRHARSANPAITPPACEFSSQHGAEIRRQSSFDLDRFWKEW